MGMCWKYWSRDPDGFPVFDSSGSLRFCGGGLAATCCPVPYYYDCDSPDDDADGYEEDPCEIPDHWTGGYDIFAVCDAYEDLGCQNGPRPVITVPSGVGGCELDYAVLCEWLLGRVSWTIENAEFSGAGTMLVTMHGLTFSSAISFAKGETKTFYVDIPEGYGDAFGTESNVLAIKTRIQLRYPDARYWDVMSYVWCEEYPGNRVPGSIVILPDRIASGMVYAEGGVGDAEDRSWRLYFNRIKSGYGTWGAASAVFTEYYDDLKAYAQKCRCARCAYNSFDFLVEFVDGWDADFGMYVLSSYAHGDGLESEWTTGECWLILTNISTTKGIICKIRNLEDGTVSEFSGSGSLGPCHKLVFGCNDPDDIDLEGGASVGGGAVIMNPTGDCTQSVIDAYEAVPGIGQHDL